MRKSYKRRENIFWVGLEKSYRAFIALAQFIVRMLFSFPITIPSLLKGRATKSNEVVTALQILEGG